MIQIRLFRTLKKHSGQSEQTNCFIIRPHFDYGDTIYDQAYNDSFHQKLKSIQYDAALAITGAIRGTSSEKLYQGLGLESLHQRRWYLKLCTFLITVK